MPQEPIEPASLKLTDERSRPDASGERQLEVAAVRGKQPVRLAFLLDEYQQFILLGEGRTAKVYLGVVIENGGKDVDRKRNNQADYVAIKCLLTDENEEYRQQIHARFKVEMAETAARGGHQQETFVKFSCQGRINLQHLRAEEEGEPLVMLLRETAQTLAIKPWPNTTLSQVLDLKGEKLEGSFYAMQLCQGSLLDVLESSDPWDEMSCYRALEWAQGNVRDVQKAKSKIVEEVVNRFLDPVPENWSGYEILNSFKNTDEANGFRGRVVLELAASIADLIRSLHSDDKGVSGFLAHRDLKPGNILVNHPLSARGVLKPVFRLSDLGYVVDRKVLERGAQSIRLDTWRTHQVPGSQFYRAPEQWTLPIEVRMRMNLSATGRGTVFQVLSSRLDGVEEGDFLTLPTKYLEKDDGRLKTIVEVSRPAAPVAGGGPRRRQRQLCLRIAEKSKSEIRHDVIAHVIKSSGFHTDGFSFGAILYDLVTGGKNPEHFYFYCLHRYQVDWDKSTTLRVESIVDELQKLGRSAKATEENVLENQKSNEPEGLISKGYKAAKEKFRLREEQERDAEPAVPPLPSGPLPGKEPTYAEYLRDERDVDIPREILLIICKCMLRGYAGCYYSSNRKGGWTADENVNAFDRILDEINTVIANTSFDLPSRVPKDFQNNPLILLRCLGKGLGLRAMGTTAPTPSSSAPAVTPPSAASG